MSDKPTSWICLKCQKFWRAYPQDVKCPECEATGDAVREEPDYWDNETRRMIAAQGDVIRRMREGCEKEWERIINRYTTLTSG